MTKPKDSDRGIQPVIVMNGAHPQFVCAACRASMAVVICMRANMQPGLLVCCCAAGTLPFGNDLLNGALVHPKGKSVHAIPGVSV